MQLGIAIVAWDLYARRDETRREHLLELLSRLGLEQFGTKHYRVAGQPAKMVGTIIAPAARPHRCRRHA